MQTCKKYVCCSKFVAHIGFQEMSPVKPVSIKYLREKL